MRRIALLLGLVLLAPHFPPVEAQSGTRIVAIGDIHGAIDNFRGILKAAGLTDAGGKWTGGRTQLIQTGDYTDRGTGTRAERTAVTAEGRRLAAFVEPDADPVDLRIAPVGTPIDPT